MLDVAVAYNRYLFLGHEFLTWLWFVLEKEMATVRDIDPDLVSIDTGNRIVLENRKRDRKETITIKGDDPGLEEGRVSLSKGALVTELNLVMKTGAGRWQFSIKGENLNISGLKVPEATLLETPEDIDAAVIDRAFLFETPVRWIDRMFIYFIKLRLSEDWERRTVPLVKGWFKT